MEKMDPNKNEKSRRTATSWGFSLIEVLVVLLIISIIVVALYNLFDENIKIYNAQQQVTTMNMRTRTAMQEIVTAIRTAGSNNVNAIYLGGNPFIAIAESDRIRVVEDLPLDANGDGDTFDRVDLGSVDGDFADDDEDENADAYINDPLEDVTFELDGTDLIRTEYLDDSYCPNGDAACTDCPADCPEPTDEVLATDIESLTFEYFTSTATQIAAPVTGNDLFNIKMVRVTIDARTKNFDRLTKRPHRLQVKSDVFLRN